MKNRKHNENERGVMKQPGILVIAGVLIILLLASGHFYARQEFNSARSATTEELKLEGSFKMNQISAWFTDEIFDAYAIANNEMVRRFNQEWNSTKSQADSIKLAKLVTTYVVEQSYYTIFMVSFDGKILIASNEQNPEIDPILVPFIQVCRSSDSTFTTDFYRSQDRDHIWIDFLVRAKTLNGSSSGVWIFRFEPTQSLYPMINYWSKPTGTTDTYLGRLEGQVIRVLNDRSFREDSVLNITYSLNQVESLIVNGAKGQSDVIKATDYRGKEILSIINKIPQTQWLIVVKSDMNEVLKDAYLKLAFLISITALSIFLLLAGAYLLYRKIRRDSFKNLFKANEEFRTVVQNINAIVFIIGQDGVFELSDGLGLRALRLTSGEVVGISARDYFRNFPKVVNGIDKVLTGEANQVEWLVQGICFDIMFTPRLDSDEKVTGAIGLATDTTEHFTAAEALKQREIWFRCLADTTSTAIFIYQGDSFVYVNRTSADLTGYSENELLGMNFWDLVHSESIEMVREGGFINEHGAMVPGRYEFKIVQKNGSDAWVDLTAGEIDWLGNPAGMSSGLDSTHRKRSEIIQKIQYNIADAAVRSKNMKDLFGIIRNELSTIIDTTNCFFVDYNKITGILTVPFEKDERLEIPPSWPAAGSLTGLLIQKSKTLLLTSKEIRQLVTDGEVRLLGTVAESWLGVPILIHNEPVGALVVQNYTNPYEYNSQSAEILEIIANQLSVYIERNRVEETALKLAKSIEQSPVSIIITDMAGTIEYVNPMFSRSTGYSSEEAIGENPRMLKSGDQTEEFYKSLWDTILSGNDWRGEFHNRKKSGDLFWENGIISPIVNEGGKITHFIAMMEDISEKRKMIEDLIIAKEHAEESDRLKSAFLANMSHEIRTPMNAIIGFSELLNESDITSSERELYTRTIQQRSLDLLAIINDILDLSSLESGQIKPVEEPGCLSDLMSDLYQVGLVIRNDLAKSELLFTTQLEDQLAHVPILANWRRLRQVLTNLINNAFKFTASGSIQVSCELRLDGFLRFVVEDSGIGIHEEKLKAVFERFIQADDSMSRKHGGVGLGLPICKGLVELMGGEIGLESFIGQGSTFYFSIPFHQIGTVQEIEKITYGRSEQFVICDG